MFRIVPKTKKKTHKKDNTKIREQLNNIKDYLEPRGLIWNLKIVVLKQ